ncbi:MAG: OPT/YSL family transporter, partial [Planctomycetota bacterium]
LAPNQPSTNLMAAAITGAGASQAADMMQDLKTGSLLGASPRKQFVAQLCGICAGVVLAVPVYSIFRDAYEIGGEKLPAPAAQAWRAMAELLTEGLSALPPHAGVAVAVAACVGVALPVARKIGPIKGFVPSGLAMGIAFIVPPYDSLVIFYGLILWWLWRRIDAEGVEKLSFAAAAGLIAGQGVMGVVNALLTLAGVEPLKE